MITALLRDQKNGSNAVFSEFQYVPGGTVEDKTPPLMVGTLNVPIVGTDSFTISWVDAQDASGIFGYEISIDGGLNYQSIGKVLSHTHNGAAPSTNYAVAVRARDVFNNYSQPLTVNIKTADLPVIKGVTVIPSNITLQGNTKQQFYAQVTGLSQDVDWTVDIGTVNAAGELTAPDGTSVMQTGTIRATSKQDPTKFGTATFTVPIKVIVPPTDVEIDPSTIILVPNRILKTAAGNYKERIGTFDVNGDTFYLTQGFWTIKKDADEELFYGMDFGPDLDQANTTIKSVIALFEGVNLAYGPKAMGSMVIVKVTGGNTSSDINAINMVTFRVTCMNGEVFDRSIFFAILEK